MAQDDEHAHTVDELRMAAARLGVPAGGQPFDHRTRDDGTVACRECGDSDWVEMNDSRQSEAVNPIPVVRPCSRCLPQAYERWAYGRHRPISEAPPRDPEPQPEQETF